MIKITISFITIHQFLFGSQHFFVFIRDQAFTFTGQPQDDFSLGLDTGSPETVYSSQTPFRGEITGLKIGL